MDLDIRSFYIRLPSNAGSFTSLSSGYSVPVPTSLRQRPLAAWRIAKYFNLTNIVAPYAFSIGGLPSSENVGIDLANNNLQTNDLFILAPSCSTAVGNFQEPTPWKMCDRIQIPSTIHVSCNVLSGNSSVLSAVPNAPTANSDIILELQLSFVS